VIAPFPNLTSLDIGTHKGVLPVTALDMAHVIRYTRLPQRIQTCCFCD
jgi:hypothetical protein